jgi:hypothetical protein
LRQACMTAGLQVDTKHIKMIDGYVQGLLTNIT